MAIGLDSLNEELTCLYSTNYINLKILYYSCDHICWVQLLKIINIPKTDPSPYNII